MKKIRTLFSLLLICVLLSALASASSAYDESLPRVVDFTDTLTESEIEGFEQRLYYLREEYSYDAVVVLIDNDTLTEENISTLQDFADDYYDNHGYGMGNDNDGVLVLMRLGEPYSNHFHLCTTGRLQFVCYEDDIDDMYYAVRPYMVDSDAAGAVSAAIDAEHDFFESAKSRGADDIDVEQAEYDYYHGDEKVKTPFRAFFNGVISAIVGLVTGLVSVSVMKGKLTTVNKKYEAADYVVPGSFNLRDSRDIFLYTHVSKVPRPQDTGRSGGGGGAGMHISSSGVSHGGGTR